MEQRAVLSILDTVEQVMMTEETLGFAPDVLSVLDNMDASNDDIERLKFRIGQDILIRIFNFANSAYYGTLKKGSIHTFYEVVTRLGMAHTKAIILIMALQLLARDDKQIEVLFARGFSTAVVGKLLAQQYGMRDDTAKKVELGGLFSVIGRMMFLLYKKYHAPDDERIDEAFISKYHPYLTERIIEVFALPDYLKDMVFHEGLVVEANHITMSGVALLAVYTVNASFEAHHDRLVVDTLPLPAGHDQTASLDHLLENQFNAVGLGTYLQIIRKRERILPEYEEKKPKA